MIERAIKMKRLTTVEAVTDYTKAGGGCLTCFDKLEEILVRVNGELVAEGLLPDHEAYRVGAADRQKIKEKAKAAKLQKSPVLIDPSPLAPSSPLPPPSAGLTNLQRIRLIEQAIEE